MQTLATEGKNPIIISLMALKGGVGKSTIALHLGYTLAKVFGLNVILYDGDSQRSVSLLALKNRIDINHKGVYQNLLEANGMCTLRQQLDAIRTNPLLPVRAANVLELWQSGPGTHGSLRIVPGLATPTPTPFTHTLTLTLTYNSGHRNTSEWDMSGDG